MAGKHETKELPADADAVVLFATCYGEYNAPNVPIAAAAGAPGHNGVRVLAPGQLPDDPDSGGGATCCGMPNLDGGDIDAFLAKVKKNVELAGPTSQGRGCPSSCPAPPAATP